MIGKMAKMSAAAASEERKAAWQYQSAWRKQAA